MSRLNRLALPGLADPRKSELRLPVAAQNSRLFYSAGLNRFAVPEVGLELITNNKFHNDLTGWSDNSATLGSIQWDAGEGGRLALVQGGGVEHARAHWNFVAVVGALYEIAVTASAENTDTVSLLMVDKENTVNTTFDSVGPGETKKFYYRATSADTDVSVRNFRDGLTLYVNSVSLKKVLEAPLYSDLEDGLTLAGTAEVDTEFGTTVAGLTKNASSVLAMDFQGLDGSSGGLIAEIGGAGAGFYVGFDDLGNFVTRCGNGVARWSLQTAYVLAPASEVSGTGTLVISIERSGTDPANVWTIRVFWNGREIGYTTQVSNTNTYESWQGGNPSAYLHAGGADTVIAGEVVDRVPAYVSASQLRMYTNATVNLISSQPKAIAPAEGFFQRHERNSKAWPIDAAGLPYEVPAGQVAHTYVNGERELYVDPGGARQNDARATSFGSSTHTATNLPALGLFTGPKLVASQGLDWHRATQNYTATLGVPEYWTWVVGEGSSGMAHFSWRDTVNARSAEIEGTFAAPTIGVQDAGTIQIVANILLPGSGLRLWQAIFTPLATGNFSFGVGPQSAVVGEDIAFYHAQRREQGFGLIFGDMAAQISVDPTTYSIDDQSIGLVNDAEGFTIYTEFVVTEKHDGANILIDLDIGSTADRIGMYLTSSGTARLIVRKDSTIVVQFGPSVPATNNAVNKVAATFTPGGCNITINGTSSAEQVPASWVTGLTRGVLGNRAFGSSATEWGNISLRDFAILPPMGDADREALTS